MGFQLLVLKIRTTPLYSEYFRKREWLRLIWDLFYVFVLIDFLNFSFVLVWHLNYESLRGGVLPLRSGNKRDRTTYRPEYVSLHTTTFTDLESIFDSEKKKDKWFQTSIKNNIYKLRFYELSSEKKKRTRLIKSVWWDCYYYRINH